MLPEKLVGIEEEIRLIYEIGDRLLVAGYTASNSVIVTVSTDYSSVIGQLLRHHLSDAGEVCEGFGIDVPYPDEEWNRNYELDLHTAMQKWWSWLLGKRIVLVEAGVIRGGNYRHITDKLIAAGIPPESITTVALYENRHSGFRSDYVGEYYDATAEDLTFWWERPNRHWQNINQNKPNNL